MTEHRGVKFEGGMVDVDNAAFSDCSFSGTRLVFRATGPVEFDNCAFENVSLRFDGSAALALSFLAKIAAGDPALHSTVERIVSDVLNNSLRFSERPEHAGDTPPGGGAALD